MSPLRRTLAFQSAYYIATGAWPLLSMRTFELVTGRKTDRWLVKMVGLLAAGIGAATATGARERRVSTETMVLAVCTAAAFCSVDVVYALKGRISRIYLADAVLEVALVVLLLRCRFTGTRENNDG